MFSGLVTFPTDLGWIGIVVDHSVIKSTTIGHANREELKANLKVDYESVSIENYPQLVDRFQRFTSGQHVSLDDLKIDAHWTTPFQNRVITACRTIPWGQTLTYGQLAALAGSPGASRAVGSVMANNRFPLIVPCHRVCSQSGPGGFSASGGVDLKKRLLANEGFVFNASSTSSTS